VSDINEIVERGRKKFGPGEFDAASDLFVKSIPDASREQTIIALARDPQAEDVVMRRAHELRARAIAPNGPKDDAREARIARINPRSPLYDTVPDANWHRAFDSQYGSKRKRG
jgi:hypothetical protein